MADVVADAGNGLATLLDPVLHPQPGPGGPTTTSSPGPSNDSQPDQPDTTSSPSPLSNIESTPTTSSKSAVNTGSASETTSQISLTPSSGTSLELKPTPSPSPTPNSISTPSSNTIPRSSSISIGGPTPSDNSMTNNSLSPNASSTDARTEVAVKAAVGVTGSAIIIILGLIVLCILRRRRRHKATRSAPSHEARNALYQNLSQSIQFSPQPRPFRGSPVAETSPSKGTTPIRAQNPPMPNKQRNIEQAVDSHRDPVPTEGSLSSNDDEDRDFGDTLHLLQSLTSQIERDAQELRAITQPGQLSTEDCLRLDEIRRANNLTALSSSLPPPYSTYVS